MRQAAQKRTESTRHGGAREQSFHRVQFGRVTHRMIEPYQPDTTTFLFFYCSLQEATANRARKPPAIDRRAIESRAFFSDWVPLATASRLHRKRVSSRSPAAARLPFAVRILY